METGKKKEEKGGKGGAVRRGSTGDVEEMWKRKRDRMESEKEKDESWGKAGGVGKKGKEGDKEKKEGVETIGKNWIGIIVE